jgi:hypothetical protein
MNGGASAVPLQRPVARFRGPRGWSLLVLQRKRLQAALRCAGAVALAASTGVVGGGCFTGAVPWPAVFLALVPLFFLVLSIRHPVGRFALGWVAGAVTHLWRSPG